MFIDALGWELAKKYKFLEKEFPNRQAVKMQMGYSSAAIPTILSGKYPQEHGHFSFYYYDPKNSPFKKFKYLKYCFAAGLHPKCLTNRSRVRAWLSKFIAKAKGFTGRFQLYAMPYDKLPLFDYCEKTDIFAPKGLSPARNLRDLLDESSLNFHISDWRKNEDENIELAKSEIKKGDLDFAFIYCADFDSFMRENIFDDKAIAARLKEYEKKALELLETLENSYKKFEFHLISSHGMTAKKSAVPLMKKVKELKLKFGKDYAAVFDSTMARFWYFNDKAKNKIRMRLCESDCYGRFLSSEEKEKYGIHFPNNKFGEDFFLMNTGMQIEPSNMAKKAPNGMCGYDPEDADSYAIHLSYKPSPHTPKEVKDFFDMMTSDIDELKKLKD